MAKGGIREGAGRKPGGKNDPNLQLYDTRLGLWLARQPERDFMSFMTKHKMFAYSEIGKRLAKKVEIAGEGGGPVKIEGLTEAIKKVWGD